MEIQPQGGQVSLRAIMRQLEGESRGGQWKRGVEIEIEFSMDDSLKFNGHAAALFGCRL